jgi:hypothetical protein
MHTLNTFFSVEKAQTSEIFTHHEEEASCGG